MSDYSKVIIFILFLVIISAAIVFIDSSVDNINKSMPDVSNGIVDGDKDYNEAVNLTNDKNFDEARNKAISAGNNFNNSLDKLQMIRNDYTSDVSDVQESYINTIFTELQLKNKAVDNLLTALDYFEVNSNYTGTNYASQANDYIYQSLEYQNARDKLVNDNPDLFKSNAIFS